MADMPTKKQLPSSSGGFFNDITNRIKLVVRLMGDQRISPFLKLLPIGSLLYLIWPLDIPFILDDAAVIWLGTTLFVELSPPEVVKEHLAKIKSVIAGEWRDPEPNLRKSGAKVYEPNPAEGESEIIEGEFRER